jgi:nicotinic acid mononucleotide adenylyltransferase
MPTKTIVFAFGRCNPPTNGHGLLVNVVKHIADNNEADYVIYVSRTQDKKKNPLPVDKKIHYLNLMFPHTNFKPATDKERTFIEVAKSLNAKYKNLIMIAGSDRIPEYEKLLNKYNGTEFHYDSIQVISAGERDPDSDDVSGMSASKMRAYATSGDFQGFKKGLPSSMRDIDAKLLFNDIRQGMDLEPIKEQYKLNVDSLREQYFNKQIFNIGNIVESDDIKYEIMDRGSNYLVLINLEGDISRKWIQDVTMSEETQLFTDVQFDKVDSETAPTEITFKGYTTKNLHNAPEASNAFMKTINNMGSADPLSVLNALKATDYYLGVTVADILHGGSEEQSDLLKWSDAHLKAKRALDHCGEFINHIEYWHLYKDKLDKAVFAVRIKSDADPIQDFSESVMLDKNKDKLKVAKMIGSILGVEDAEKLSNPEQIVNSALRKSKSLPKDSQKIIKKMLKLADEVGIKYDKKATKIDLTEEQVKLATERAERYGRRYPNPIDEQWVLKEGKAPSIEMDKSKVGQVASLRPDDEQKLTKLNKMGKGEVVEQGIPAETKKEIENYANTGHTDGVVRKDGQNQPEYTHVGASLTSDNNDTLARMKAKKLRNESKECDDCDDFDMTDIDIDKEINQLSDDDYLEAYDPEEFSVVDVETGEEEKEEKPVNEEALNEVLSKIERMKAKLRFAKNRAKIDRARMLALKKRSDSKTINKRARHLAVNVLRKKLLRGKDLSSLSSAERDRIDRIIEKKKKVIGRMAMKLTTKIRDIEKNRLSHKNFTKGN